MRSKTVQIVIFCALTAIFVWSCAPVGQDPFAELAKGFFAEVEGEVNGVALAATLQAAPQVEGLPRAVTVTVYAPSGLSGTVLCRDETGTVTVTVGELATALPEGEAFGALFDLFPTTGEITRVQLDENSRTRVTYAGGELILLPDGTPYALRTANATLRVVRFAGL